MEAYIRIGNESVTAPNYVLNNYRAGLEPKFYSDAVSFHITLYNLNYGITEKMIAEREKVAFELFNNFEYERPFSRSDIIKICSLAPSSAGKMLNKLKETGLIEAAVGQGRGKYKFIEPKE